MADNAAFIQVFTDTLSPDQNTRLKAELQLRQVEAQNGMLSAVLAIISNEAVNTQARLNAAIYLKNRCNKAWPSGPLADARASIPLVDREYVKQNILGILCAISGNNQLKLQLKTALGSIIYNEDFAKDWPALLPSALAGLQSGDLIHAEASLMALVEMFKKYRFMAAGRDIPSQLIEQVLPILAKLASGLLASTTAPDSPPAVGRLLHLTFKVYRLSSQVELALYHQSSIVEWGTLLLQVVNRQLNSAQLPSDAEDREKSPWWKAKKWAYFNLNRLFLRYGSPSQLPSNMQEYLEFAKTFEAHFAPEIFRAYLKQAEGSITGQSWLSQRCTKHIIDFLDECVKPKSTWALLKPQLDNLVSHFLFPLICPGDEELAEFDSDPVEYAKLHSSEVVLDYYVRPESSALGLLSTLAEARSKVALAPLLTFATSIVQEYPAKRSPKELEGALKMISTLAAPIVKSKTYGAHMERFFEQFVFPLFRSEHGFLRSRACNLVEVFESEDMTWKNTQNINIMFDFISGAMVDPALPVRIAAATALPELVRYEQLRELVAPNIGRIMHDLLSLANEVDLDIMSDTMRKLVDDFSQELLPFSEQLSVQLCQSYLRIMQESLDSRETGGEEDGTSEEKALAALGTLKTLQDLLSSVESSPEIIAKLEPIVLPSLLFTLVHEFTELYDEVFDMINTFVFRQRAISENMWRAFEAIHTTFKSTAIDFLDEMFAPLDNFISFGGPRIAQKPEYTNMLLDIFTTTLTSEDLGAGDRITGLKLAESMLLNMRGLLDQALPLFLSHSLSIITRTNTNEEPIITNPLYLTALELVIDALFYNPVLTIQYLDANNQTQAVFDKWFKKLDKFTRVHDRKLGIVAVCAILTSLPSLPAFAESGHHLLAIASKLFEERQREEKEYEQSASSESTIGDEEGMGEEVVNGEDDGEDGDFTDGNVDYEDYLKKKILEKISSGQGDDESDISEAWADEVLFESPLDQIDVYTQFVTTLSTLQTSQPALFQKIVGGLDAQQQSQLHEISTRAQSGGEKAILAAEQAAATA